MSILEKLWNGTIAFSSRPVKKGSALERKLCLYAQNSEKLNAMLSELQKDQYEKTMAAFNEAVAETELEAFELGFTFAARMMIDVMQSAEVPRMDEI